MIEFGGGLCPVRFGLIDDMYFASLKSPVRLYTVLQVIYFFCLHVSLKSKSAINSDQKWIRQVICLTGEKIATINGRFMTVSVFMPSSSFTKLRFRNHFKVLDKSKSYSKDFDPSSIYCCVQISSVITNKFVIFQRKPNNSYVHLEALFIQNQKTWS